MLLFDTTMRYWQPLFASTGGHWVNIGGAFATFAVLKAVVLWPPSSVIWTDTENGPAVA